MATSGPGSTSTSVQQSGQALRAPAATAAAVGAGLQPPAIPASGIKLARIQDGDGLDFTPLPTGFGSDLSETLGNYGTDADGWEDLLLTMELSIAPDADALDSVLSILDDITDADYPSFAAANFDPVTASLAPFYATGDNLITAFNTDLNPPPPPQPTPPPPPPGGGTGGGGGGDGGGSGGGRGGAPPIPLPCGTGSHPTPGGGCEPDPHPQQPS